MIPVCSCQLRSVVHKIDDCWEVLSIRSKRGYIKDLSDTEGRMSVVP